MMSRIALPRYWRRAVSLASAIIALARAAASPAGTSKPALPKSRGWAMRSISEAIMGRPNAIYSSNFTESKSKGSTLKYGATARSAVLTRWACFSQGSRPGNSTIPSTPNSRAFCSQAGRDMPSPIIFRRKFGMRGCANASAATRASTPCQRWKLLTNTI